MDEMEITPDVQGTEGENTSSDTLTTMVSEDSIVQVLAIQFSEFNRLKAEGKVKETSEGCFLNDGTKLNVIH
jgi:hypothetical protein